MRESMDWIVIGEYHYLCSACGIKSSIVDEGCIECLELKKEA